MKKPQFPATGEEKPFSGNVEFPSAEIGFIDGTKITLRPKYESHSVTGVHYVLEVEGPPEGPKGEMTRATIGLTFVCHGHGEDRRRWIDLEAEYGKPLQLRGERYGFEFKDHHASFYPRSHYRLNGVTDNGGYRVEVDSLRSFRIYQEEVKDPGDLY